MGTAREKEEEVKEEENSMETVAEEKTVGDLLQGNKEEKN